MKSVVWEGKPFNVSVREMARPQIVKGTDCIVRVTTSSICSSDLHLYHGLLGSTTPPWPMGHEAMGYVTEVGPDVSQVKVGDRVVVADLAESDVLELEPELIPALSIYGFGSQFGNLGGCQAEFIRVPSADSSVFVVNDAGDIPDKELLFLSDIFPTGWGTVTASGFQAGDAVVVFCAGPMGLLCAYRAVLRGASVVYSVDHVPSRLALAKSIGAVPIDLIRGSPADQILALRPGCVDADLKPDSSYVLEQAVAVTSTNGGVALMGVYMHQADSAGAPRAATIPPFIRLPLGFWEKALTIRSGVVASETFAETLYGLILAGRARPGFIVSAQMAGYCVKAAEAYRQFSDHEQTKIMFTFPGAKL